MEKRTIQGLQSRKENGENVNDFCIEHPAPGFYSLIGIKTPGLTASNELGLLLAQKSDPGPGKQRIVSTAMGAGVYFSGLILINWLFFGGNFTGFGVTLVVLLAGAALGNLSLWKGRGGSTRRRYKIPKI